MATNGRTTEPTPRQRRAIVALLGARSVPAAAKAAALGERTLYRWLAQDPVFQHALREAEANAIAEAMRRLAGLQGKALDVLDRCMDAGAQPDARLSAATVLAHALRLRELVTVEQRLQALEETLNERS